MHFFFQFIKKDGQKFAEKNNYVYFCTQFDTKTIRNEVYV